MEWVPEVQEVALRLGFLLGGVSLDECIVQRRLKGEISFKGWEKLTLFIHW